MVTLVVRHVKYRVAWFELGWQRGELSLLLAMPSTRKRTADESPVASARGSGTPLVSPKKPRSDAPDIALPEMPDLPDNRVHVSTYTLMRQVVPFVLHAFPAALDGMGIKHEKEMVACPPLPITASEDGAVLRNFKEVWNPANCKISIETTDMYEAGGNMLWVDMNLGAAGKDSDTVIREEPSMEQVLEYANQFFSLSGGGVAPRPTQLVYPDTIETAVADINAVFSGGASNVGKTLPSKLNLVAGHPLFFAWYWSAGEALRDNDPVRIRALW